MKIFLIILFLFFQYSCIQDKNENDIPSSSLNASMFSDTVVEDQNQYDDVCQGLPLVGDLDKVDPSNLQVPTSFMLSDVSFPYGQDLYKIPFISLQEDIDDFEPYGQSFYYSACLIRDPDECYESLGYFTGIKDPRLIGESFSVEIKTCVNKELVKESVFEDRQDLKKIFVASSDKGMDFTVYCSKKSHKFFSQLSSIPSDLVIFYEKIKEIWTIEKEIESTLRTVYTKIQEHTFDQKSQVDTIETQKSLQTLGSEVFLNQYLKNYSDNEEISLNLQQDGFSLTSDNSLPGTTNYDRCTVEQLLEKIEKKSQANQDSFNLNQEGKDSVKSQAELDVECVEDVHETTEESGLYSYRTTRDSVVCGAEIIKKEEKLEETGIIGKMNKVNEKYQKEKKENIALASTLLGLNVLVVLKSVYNLGNILYNAKKVKTNMESVANSPKTPPTTPARTTIPKKSAYTTSASISKVPSSVGSNLKRGVASENLKIGFNVSKIALASWGIYASAQTFMLTEEDNFSFLETDLIILKSLFQKRLALIDELDSLK